MLSGPWGVSHGPTSHLSQKGPKDTCLTHVRFLGPGAAGLGAGTLGRAVGTDPAAHLDATLFFLSLLNLARTVAASSTLGQGSVENFGAEEGAGAMELAEVAQGDDGIHGARRCQGPAGQRRYLWAAPSMLGNHAKDSDTPGPQRES